MRKKYPNLKGLIVFFSSHHAIRAIKVLNENNLQAYHTLLPREIAIRYGCGCGEAGVRFDYDKKSECKRILDRENVRFEKFLYFPEGEKK